MKRDKNKKVPSSKFQVSRIYVGLSGGVDSSVSAYLLKKQGHDVTGVFIKVWHPDFLECDWKNDRRDAMKICAQLEIPFMELDLSKEYKKDVADYMIDEYKKGRTPNPDVMCNKYVKFGGFLDWALSEGADYVATGHYARIVNDSSQKSEVRSQKEKNLQTTNYQLLTGADGSKDQSYFLWTLTQEQLSKIIFPIGDIEKPEVRKIAKKAGLITATKKDSQGVCFLGEISMKDFLTRLADPREGDVLNEEGIVIGKHNGSILYTIGERRGFLITKKTPNDKPYFVVSKDLEKNTITVSDKENEGALFNGKVIKLIKTNWIPNEPKSGKYMARIRYRQLLQPCTFQLLNTVLNTGCLTQTVGVVFDSAQKATAVGQSVVIYDGEKCIGGGIIEEIGI